jgi:hypothetical protein
MKSLFRVTLIVVTALSVAIVPAAVGQKTEPRVTVPKYDPANEATFKGTVLESRDHECPVSGGMGSHLILKLLEGKTIEVHLAATRFVKSYGLVLNKGDQVDVVGTKVQFEGKDTIFAREVTRGTETFAFREKNGTPIW